MEATVDTHWIGVCVMTRGLKVTEAERDDSSDKDRHGKT